MNRLKELRQEKKLSQKAIAEMLAVNEKTVSRWENEESQIKPVKAKQLANYFGVGVGYLLGYSDLWVCNLSAVEGFYWGNAIKYMLSFRHKNGLEDLKKARKNLDWLIKEKERAEHENQF